MTKKDYENIARVLINNRPDIGSNYYTHWESIVDDLATLFESKKDRSFDTEKFLVDAGTFLI